MDRDRETRDAATPSPARTRSKGMRRVRQLSNWTAAALLVGTAGGTVALAQHTAPVTGPASGAASTGTTGTPGAGAATTTGAGGPHVAHTVATTSASGVTTTTTTRVVNGRTVVTHSRSAPAFHDD
jgi:hypothetical protein